MTERSHPNEVGDALFECEEALYKQYSVGGFPYVVLRTANLFGPEENTFRYWLLHLWVRAHRSLGLPLHLQKHLKDVPLSLTYTHDIGTAVLAVLRKHENVNCCPEDVHAQAFNIASDQPLDQYAFFMMIADQLDVLKIEAQIHENKSVQLYPENTRGHVSVEKALKTLQWSPKSLPNALRATGMWYDRVMVAGKFAKQRKTMYTKLRNMIKKDGKRFTNWVQDYYETAKKEGTYVEFDDDEEEQIWTVQVQAEKKKGKIKKRSANPRGEM